MVQKVLANTVDVTDMGLIPGSGFFIYAFICMEDIGSNNDLICGNNGIKTTDIIPNLILNKMWCFFSISREGRYYLPCNERIAIIGYILSPS